jgi:hypothetical protein
MYVSGCGFGFGDVGVGERGSVQDTSGRNEKSGGVESHQMVKEA